MNAFPPLGVWLHELRNEQECAELEMGKKSVEEESEVIQRFIFRLTFIC